MRNIFIKNLFILLAFFIPCYVQARISWSFKTYSLLFGQQYRFKQSSFWAFEFQYDRFARSCLYTKKYFGMGAVFSFNERDKQITLKTMWSPTRMVMTIWTNNPIRFYPYLYGQFIYFLSETENQITGLYEKVKSYYFRPGIGLTVNIMEESIFPIKSSFQVGYSIPLSSTNEYKNPFTFEFKLGIGIDMTNVKRKREMKKKEEQ